ncbi:MAG TPA: hypothetical protein VMF08_00735, partial [Candidatus Sulfotelmatobacter sp.]|nr:hypothetical protein [Candidatus Sulfotelmatobacter sp.]
MKKETGQKVIAHLLLAVFIVVGARAAAADTAKISASYAEHNRLTVRVDGEDGAYSVREKRPAWTFSGAIGQRLANLKTRSGVDFLGAYHEISFEWTSA